MKEQTDGEFLTEMRAKCGKTMLANGRYRRLCALAQCRPPMSMRGPYITFSNKHFMALLVMAEDRMRRAALARMKGGKTAKQVQMLTTGQRITSIIVDDYIDALKYAYSVK